MTGDEAADESASAIQEAVGFLTTFLLIFAGISLVVGAFLIVNTFSILVAQRSRELALLRALGASKKQVNRSVLLEALVLGLLGSTIGLGLGVLLAMRHRVLFAQFGLDLSGPAVDHGAADRAGGVRRGRRSSPWARPSSRPAGPPGSPPSRPCGTTIAMPDSSLRRRLLIGVVLMVAGGASPGRGPLRRRPAPGLLRRRRHPGHPARRRVREPGDQSSAAGCGGLGLLRSCSARSGARRPELAAQPAAHDRDVVGPDDRVCRSRARWPSSATRPRPASTRRSRRTSSATTSSAVWSGRASRPGIGRADVRRARRGERVGATLRHHPDGRRRPGDRRRRTRQPCATASSSTWSTATWRTSSTARWCSTRPTPRRRTSRWATT